MNVTLFGNRVFADVIKLKWSHTELGWALIQYDWCTDKKRKMPCDDRGRDWSDAAASQGVPRIASHNQKLGGKKDSIQSFRGSMVLLAPWFWTSSLHYYERIYFCCFKPFKKIYLFFINLFIYLFIFGHIGLCCCVRAFPGGGERRLLFVAVRRLLIVVASLVAEHGL